MKSQMVHTCEICGRSSIDKKLISDCEKSHIKVDKLHKENYDIRDNKGKYPISIDMLMEDGKIIKYSRK